MAQLRHRMHTEPGPRARCCSGKPPGEFLAAFRDLNSVQSTGWDYAAVVGPYPACARFGESSAHRFGAPSLTRSCSFALPESRPRR
jgi:hypothetical protein